MAKQRSLHLDVLRGVAILLVMGRHYQPPTTGVFAGLSFHWLKLGWTGVQLFFVLSGFLIGGLLFREMERTGQLNIKRFLLRRGFKIWPAYYVYLFYCFLLLHFVQHLHGGATFRLLGPNLIHVQNYFVGPRGHTWSLAVEEHFYTLLPLVLVGLAARARKRYDRDLNARDLGLLLPVIAVLCALGRWYYALTWDGAGVHIGSRMTHCTLDGLYFGVYLAYLHLHCPNTMIWLRARRGWLAALGLLLLLPADRFKFESPWLQTLGIAALFAGFGALLLVFVLTNPAEGVLGKVLKTLPARAIAFMGYYSYSIYLWHTEWYRLNFMAMLDDHLAGLPVSAHYILSEMAFVALATALGVLTARLVELPALRLRDRLLPVR